MVTNLNIFCRYTWIKVPDHMTDSIREHGFPYPSPTLVGCAIAVERDNFNRIGRYVYSIGRGT